MSRAGRLLLLGHESPDKAGLVALSLAVTVVGPLYAAADIMVYKSTGPKDIGSITSTTACIRNAYRTILGLVSGLTIYFLDHTYRPDFILGISMSTLSLLFFPVHRRLMRKPTLAGP